MADPNPPQVLVLGATGGVGRFVCAEVIRLLGSTSLVVGDYRAARGQEYARALGDDVSSERVEVGDRATIEQALDGRPIGAVIVAVQQADPIVQSVCMSRSIPCLDVTVDGEVIERIRRLGSEPSTGQAASIIMAGLMPGLSGVMAKHLAESMHDVSSIDVGLLQSAQGSAGATGMADMLGVLAQPVQLRINGEELSRPGFTVRREMEFPEPFGTKHQRLINWIEAPVVAERCGVHDVNYWTGFDEAAFERRLMVLKKMGILGLFNRKNTRNRLARIFASLQRGHRPDAETIGLTVEVSGERKGAAVTRRLSLVGPSDYGTTAMSVVAMTKLLIHGRVTATGARVPLEVFPLPALIEAMDSDDVTLHTLS